MANIEVIGFGALNMDYIYKVERIVEDGETVVTDATLSPGGSAANTIYGLGKLGIKTGFAGVIGDDTEGSIMMQDFQTVHVDSSQVKTKHNARTGSAVCLSDKIGHRSLYIMPGANNLLTKSDLDVNYINKTNILHISSFVAGGQFELTLELVERLEESVQLSFSPGSLYAARGIQALAPILERTNILFINQNEIRQLTGQDVIGGAEALIRRGAGLVIVTLGKGTRLGAKTAVCYIREPKNEYFIEPSGKEKASPLDSTGAGDAFATGFLYGLLKKFNLKECGLLGDITAGFSLAKIGARQGLPTISELMLGYHERREAIS